MNTYSNSNQKITYIFVITLLVITSFFSTRTIAARSCSLTGIPCNNDEDCPKRCVNSIFSGELCNTEDDCKSCDNGPNKGINCSSDSDCPGICVNEDTNNRECNSDFDCATPDPDGIPVPTPNSCRSKGKCVGSCLGDRCLLATLSSFNIIAFKEGIKVDWVTKQEENNEGMNIWCAQMKDNSFKNIFRLNEKNPIPSKSVFAFTGAEYSVSRKVKSGLYYCVLEDIATNGSCTTHCNFLDGINVNNQNQEIDLEKASKLCNEVLERLREEKRETCIEKIINSEYKQ